MFNLDQDDPDKLKISVFIFTANHAWTEYSYCLYILSSATYYTAFQGQITRFLTTFSVSKHMFSTRKNISIIKRFLKHNILSRKTDSVASDIIMLWINMYMIMIVQEKHNMH